jgi:hypothetical protein
MNQRKFADYVRTGAKTQPVTSSGEGGFLLPEKWKRPKVGRWNALLRFLHLGGYEVINLQDAARRLMEKYGDQ